MLAALALAAVVQQCSWDNPGADPFMGDVVAAVDRYKEIPSETREVLKEKMRLRKYDDIALITKHDIRGDKIAFTGEISDMHFGNGRICKTVTRSKWKDSHQERGLIYCADGQCIIVPTVCRNVSRVYVAPVEEPLEFDPPAAGVREEPASTGNMLKPLGMQSFEDISHIGFVMFEDELQFDPPAAGPITRPLMVPPARPALPPGINTPVPEPATWLLMVLGAAFIFIINRKTNAKNHVV